MANISQYQAVIEGQLITHTLWNGMELNIINNGLIPSGIEDYSATDGEMQTQTDPYPASATSRATSLQGELERHRYIENQIKGSTYWYEDPAVNLLQLSTHDHSDYGSQVVTGGIADAAVDENKLAASVAGDCLTGGAGTALTPNVDDSTIEKSGGNLQVKDGGIVEAKIGAGAVTNAKIGADAVDGTKIADDSIDSEHIVNGAIDSAHLSSEVLALMSPKSIQTTSGSVTFSSESGTKTANVTISSVDTSKAYVILNGIELQKTGGNWIESVDEGHVQGYAILTGATTVQIGGSYVIASSGTLTGIVKIYFTVVEWN